ncbi:hypothetical protein PPYR_03944 [Photinus pyralis]|uniref:Vacuolar protein sorting-associated protein 16 homolog n=1 Tax=Photinus pyralis TaxID=7054 RepID=A0A1Y1NG99_PHOPY|nr:vacuolar protein sorting-associated protein 16 homolog [Photinus pyralis]KAB0801758.1 hypothetical protein PPYR_03944 [Photinus pyralis]
MSAAMITADWFLLGRDLYFRKFEVYAMGWHQDINMDQVIAEAASYGGPIAVRRDETKIIKVRGTGHQVIEIFSGSGKKISSIKWTRKPIVKMGWSLDEKFVCVQDDSQVIIHDLFGNFMHAFTLSQETQDAKIIDAKIFISPQNVTGIAVMTANYKLFVFNNILEPKKRQLSELPRSNIRPTAWAVISEECGTEVLIAREKELFRLKQDEYHTTTMLQPDIAHVYTSIIEMAVSINARHVALFTDAGYIWLGSSNLRSKYCEIDTNSVRRPKQLVWCGTEAVVAFWEKEPKETTLIVLGRHGEMVTYPYDGSIALIPEIDGVRVLSAFQHELIQKVPDVVQKIFRINSTEPGSFLLEASKQFQKRSHRADEYICLVKNALTKAVAQCIEAAGYEFDTDVQKMLIRAAQFGKCFVESIDSEDYVRMCRLLRVLNSVRDRRIGIPITFTELFYSGHKFLLDRLVTRRQYYLAICIAKYLKMPDKDGSSRILVHWAKYKVSQPQLDEESVAREIANKFGYASGISYSDIATTAANCGRKQLAIKLLDHESKASEQVQLLLKLDENKPALLKAIESGDTDLVYMVILRLRDNMPLADFKMTIRNFPVALSLYIKYCRQHNPQALNEIFIQEDDFNSQAQGFILESLDEKKTHTQDASLTSAVEAYKKARNDVSFSICEEALRLLKYQRSLKDKINEDLVGKSVHDTCTRLLELKDIKEAERMRSNFKIPDRRYWWLRIKCLADAHDWIELEKFSKSKKSPIGYAHFVDVCLEKNNISEAVKYLPRVSEDIIVKYYVKANKLEEAAQIAYEQRDIQGLLYVQSKSAAQSSLSEKINAQISLLGARK